MLASEYFSIRHHTRRTITIVRPPIDAEKYRILIEKSQFSNNYFFNQKLGDLQRKIECEH